MNKTILKRMAATAACLGMMGPALPALAADLPMEPYVADAPIFDWSGGYVGLHGGYGWADASAEYTSGAPCDAPFPFGCAVDLDPDGAFVGAQVGWNFVFGGGWMLGIEGDYSVGKLTDSGSGVGAVPAFETHVDHEIDQLATVQARLGWAAGPWLPFATIGWGWAKHERASFNPVIPVDVSESNWHDGLTLGGGVEYAIGTNWSVKGEYRYMDLGKETYFSGPGETEVDLELHTVRFGVNYLF